MTDGPPGATSAALQPARPVASVIVPVHNAGKTLADQLAALARQVEAAEFEVVVVLNRCTDSSRPVAESFAARLREVIIHADVKASAGYARNVGAAHSSAPFLLFCDADDRVGDRWVAEMVKPLADGSADFVGGSLVVDRERVPKWMYRRLHERLEGPHLRPWRAMLYPIGASLGVTRAAFEAAGGFDESFAGAGVEEVDLAFRLLRQGRRVGIASNATFLYRPRTTLLGELKTQRNYAWGKALLELKEGSPPTVTSRWHESKVLVRTIGSLVVRQRQWHPGPLAVRAVSEHSWYDAMRKLASAGPAPAHTATRRVLDDFVAPLATPVLGGLAFLAQADRVNWWVSDGLEPASLGLTQALLREGDTVVDCGANIGVFTVCAASCVGPTGHVVAFEPDPQAVGCLRENLRRHEVADRVAIRCRVPVAPLDDALALTSVDLLRIDGEGFELEVLAGSRKVLDRSPNAVVFVELNPALLRNTGRSPDALAAAFSTEQWSLWLIDEKAQTAEQKIRPFDAATRTFVASAPRTWRGSLLAVPHHRHDEVVRVITGITGITGPRSAA